MPIDVTVTGDGKLAISVDGVQGIPLSVEAVEALCDRLPEARNALMRADLTVQVKALVDAFTVAPDSLDAHVHVTATGLVAQVDQTTFTSLQNQLGVQPDQDGALRSGLIEVWNSEPAEDEPSP